MHCWTNTPSGLKTFLFPTTTVAFLKRRKTNTSGICGAFVLWLWMKVTANISDTPRLTVQRVSTQRLDLEQTKRGKLATGMALIGAAVFTVYLLAAYITTWVCMCEWVGDRGHPVLMMYLQCYYYYEHNSVSNYPLPTLSRLPNLFCSIQEALVSVQKAVNHLQCSIVHWTISCSLMAYISSNEWDDCMITVLICWQYVNVHVAPSLTKLIPKKKSWTWNLI